MFVLRGERVVDIPLAEGLSPPKRVDAEGETVAAARGARTCFGD